MSTIQGFRQGFLFNRDKGSGRTDGKTHLDNLRRRTTTNHLYLDEDGAKSDSNIKIKHFDEPSKEWALFIMSNRSKVSPHPYHNYDIVIGPVADDTIASLFRNFNDGIIDLEMLVRGLKYKNISSQYLFHTPNSLKHLHFHE